MSGLSIIIPARYGSERFEGKPLAKIHDRPMIQHVYERAKKAYVADHVIVATDDERILRTVEDFGGNAVMTSASHTNGTQRVAEAAKSINSEWIINLQADEPLIDPVLIRSFSQEMISSSEEEMFSLMRPLFNKEEFINPNMVKVVVDNMYHALYFSRAPIPYPKAGLQVFDEIHNKQQQALDNTYIKNIFIHIGIYGYRKDFLLRISGMPPSYLEYTESLEQLRVLANGYRIRMVFTKYRSMGVDTHKDIEAVESLLRSRQHY